MDEDNLRGCLTEPPTRSNAHTNDVHHILPLQLFANEDGAVEETMANPATGSPSTAPTGSTFALGLVGIIKSPTSDEMTASPESDAGIPLAATTTTGTAAPTRSTFTLGLVGIIRSHS